MPEEEKRKSIEFCPLQREGCDRINQVTSDMTEAKEELKEQGKTIASMDQKINGIVSNISDIKIALKGNGREGLCDRVTRVEGKTKFNMWFSLLIIGGIVTALIVVGLSHFLK